MITKEALLKSGFYKNEDAGIFDEYLHKLNKRHAMLSITFNADEQTVETFILYYPTEEHKVSLHQSEFYGVETLEDVKTLIKLHDGKGA